MSIVHHADVIVLGIGGIGSATASTLARRGFKVIGLDQFPFAHNHGSSHGESRIIRTAYYEDPVYVPLVQRSFELWHALEQRLGRNLLIHCPCLSLGDAQSAMLHGVKASAQEHQLPVENLSSSQIQQRYPQFHVPDSIQGILEHQAGILAVEACVQAHIDDTLSTNRVQFFTNEAVQDWQANQQEVCVTTATAVYRADRLIICAGSWSRQLLQGLSLPLTIMRQLMHWFPSAGYTPSKFPIFMLESPRGDFYGIPDAYGNGVKCAQHYGAGEVTHPDDIRWKVEAAERQPIEKFLGQYLPELAQSHPRSQVCMYTLTPDRHFILDRHPEYESVVFGAGFSGHGFKFAPILGEILADLAISGKSSWDLSRFSAQRFSIGRYPLGVGI